MVERVGDLVLQSRCLTYRAVAYRRLGDVGHCRTEAEKTCELATKLGMVEFIAMAKANLAWWHGGRKITRRQRGSPLKRSIYGMGWTIRTVLTGWRFGR